MPLNLLGGIVAGGAQQLVEKTNGGETVTLRLHQNVNDGIVLVDGAPEIMLHTIDGTVEFSIFAHRLHQ
jgi:hypothetical protein